MIPGEEPAIGEVLHLRKPSENKPTLRDQSEDSVETIQVTEVKVEEDGIEVNLDEVASKKVERDVENQLEVLEESETAENAGDISDDGSDDGSDEEALSDLSSATEVSVQVPDSESSASAEDETSTPEFVEGGEKEVAEEYTEVTEPLELTSVHEEIIAPDVNQAPTESDISEPSSEVMETRERSFHKVSEGETLFSIARLYDLTLMNLKQWNALDGVTIEAGQKLFVEPR
jgi:LysM repeat protein